MAKRPAACYLCGRTAREAGRISLSGRCADCAVTAQVANAEQLRARAGPYYERWLSGQLAAAERAITLSRDRATEAA